MKEKMCNYFLFKNALSPERAFLQVNSVVYNVLSFDKKRRTLDSGSYAFLFCAGDVNLKQILDMTMQLLDNLVLLIYIAFIILRQHNQNVVVAILHT